MRRSVVIAGLSLVLAACATTAGRRPGITTPAGPPVSAGGGGAAGSADHAPRARALIVARASAMLGQPYRYGGAAPGGFDCSGLVSYAAAGAGIHVPRTAIDQLRAGAPIPRSQLQAGDLVFMHLRHKELHVGIALDDRQFIHAPATGRRVRIDSLSAPPYARAFVAARRIVADGPAAAGRDGDALQSRTGPPGDHP